MEKDKLESSIQELRKIKLGSEEKEAILQKILTAPRETPAPIKSPWNRSFFYLALIPCLVLMLAGGGLVWAAEQSLPGDLLYPLKTGVFEPVAGTFKFSPESKMKHQGTLAIKRFAETEELIRQGRLDDAKEEQIGILLYAHTDKFNENRGQAEKSTKTESIVRDLGDQVDEHKKILETINTGEENSLPVPDTVFEKVDKVKKNLNREDTPPEKDEKAPRILEPVIESGEEIIEETIQDLPDVGNAIENLGL